jgi:hypothetical protein
MILEAKITQQLRLHDWPTQSDPLAVPNVEPFPLFPSKYKEIPAGTQLSIKDSIKNGIVIKVQGLDGQDFWVCTSDVELVQVDYGDHHES